jgi:DNA polymerase-3 subunit alpha
MSEVQENGMDSIAITDHGNMFGVIDFYKAAQKAGIHPVLGVEVYTSPRGLEQKDPVLDRYGGHLVLLAENNEGYANLVRIVSAANVRGFYYKPRVDKDFLRAHSEGIIALSACIAGDVPKKLLSSFNEDSKIGNPSGPSKQEYEAAKKEALIFQDIFGKGNFFLELQDQSLPAEDYIRESMIRLSRETGIELVATNDVHYTKKEHAEAHDVLLCIQTGKKIHDTDRMKFSNDQFYLRSEEEMLAYFKDIPEALENTAKIAARCNVEIEFGKYHLPEFNKTPEGMTNSEYLRVLCNEGLAERYGDSNGNISQSYLDRLEHEIAIIEDMGFVEYFLIVWDFIKYARDSGIPVGPGRGSAAGSIVAYSLRITDIDPIRYGLIFERFLNPERVSMPDIDIDFCEERRGEVIKYVIDTYGEEKVAQIITFGTLKPKAVIKDVARAMDFPLDKANKIASLIPEELKITLGSAIEKSKDLRALIASDPDVKRLMDYAFVLEGKARHAGTHAAGVVIAKKSLDEYVPLFNNKTGISTQFTMTTIEELGLLKMDFLGLRNLTVIEDALKMIEKNHDIKIEFEKMDYDDPAVYELISSGDTDGVFQLENAGMREFMQKLRPSGFEDIVAGISLYRPGPMDDIPKYLAGKKDRDNTKYMHPTLAPILKDTYGVMVYQEQVMQIVRDLAGYDYGRSDEVRRAMSKKKESVMQKQREYFVHGLVSDDGRDVPGCVANGIPEKIANQIYDAMIDFASYAFNKSHAAAYAVVSYRTAYLKAHYPEEFMAALMSSFMGGDGTKVAQYIRNAADLGIKILPPTVTDSQRKFSAENGAIRMGLRSIKNVGEGAIEHIVAIRESGVPIKNLRDFVDNIDITNVNKKAFDCLVYAGAFDTLQPNRALAMRQVELYQAQARTEGKRVIEGQATLFDLINAETGDAGEDLSCEDWPLYERLVHEKNVIGVYMSGHPLDDYKWLIEKVSNTNTDIIGNLDDNMDMPKPKDVIMVGLIENAKVFQTKKGKMMATMLFEDLLGSVKVVVFPKTFEQCSDAVLEGKIVVVRGREEHQPEELPAVIASKVTPIDIVEDFYIRRGEGPDDGEQGG